MFFQGTFGGPLSSALAYSRSRRCPAGFYCPSPSQQIPCKAGTYCVESSVEEYTCKFTDLLYQDALAEVPNKPTTGAHPLLACVDCELIRDTKSSFMQFWSSYTCPVRHWLVTFVQKGPRLRKKNAQEDHIVQQWTRLLNVRREASALSKYGVELT